MKKEYIKPVIDVMEFHTCGVLADSLPKDESDSNGVSDETEVLSIEFFGGGDSSEDW